MSRRVLLGLLLLSGLVAAASGQMIGQPARPTAMEPPLAPGMSAPPGPSGPSGPAIPAGSAPPRSNAPLADPPAPQVTIRVRVPALAHPNEELVYHFYVQNVTPTATAHHVRVRAPIPSNSKFMRANPAPDPANPDKEQLIWNLDSMPGGTSKEITLVVLPTGAGEVNCCARVQFEHGQCVKTRLTQPDLRVKLLGPSQVQLNDLPKYQIEVSNVGQREAAGVIVTNTLPDPLQFLKSTPDTDDHGKGQNPVTWTLGAIPAGQSKRIVVETLAQSLGSTVNKAAVKDSSGQKQEATLKVDVVEPKLDLTLIGPKQRLFGRPSIYKILVSNSGTASATNVEVWSKIPAQIVFRGASGGGQVTGDEVHWKLGTIPPGTKQTLEVTLEARTGGTFQFGVASKADRLSPAGKKIITDFRGASNLAMDLDKHPNPIEVGQLGTYTLRLVNMGSAASTAVKATLTFPEELKVQEATGPVQPRQEGQNVIVELPTLTSGGEVSVLVKARAMKAGEVQLRGEITARELTSGPIRFEESAMLHSEKPAPPPGGAKPPGS